MVTRLWLGRAALVVALVSSTTAQSTLFVAAQQGNLDEVERLLKTAADANATGEVRIGDRTYRVSALAAAAIEWHADVARLLLERGAGYPRYFVRNHNLVPASAQELAPLRDWEVVNSILRTPEVAPLMRAIVDRDAAGAYRTHDGREYAVRSSADGVELRAADGTVLTFRPVQGKAFVQQVPQGQTSSIAGRARTAQDLAMFDRFVEPMAVSERTVIQEQFRDRGGSWLDFTVGEGRVLAFEIREGGPGRLGGTPTLFRKVGVRPEASPILEREVAATRPTTAPMHWPSFRGPNASGIADGQAPPLSWDEERALNIRWRVPVPGLGHSSPIVWGDKVFVTTAISSQPRPEFRPGGLRGDNVSSDRTEQEWQLLAFEKATGKLLWQRTAHRGIPRGIRHLKSSFATATPATDGSRIVAMFGSEGLYCYDMDGTLIWKKDLGQVGHISYGFGSSPILFQGMVIVQADTNRDVKSATPASFIAAFDLADGRERWRVPREEDGGASFGSPIVHQSGSRAQVITNGGTRVRSYDPANGKELWSISAPSDIVTPSPVASPDLIYVMSGNSGYQPIFAIRPTAVGDITPKPGQDTNDFVAWSSTRGGSFTPTPIVYGDYLYSMNVSGILGCYDAKTGQRQYLQRIQHGGSGFSSSPVAADGRLYFASEDGDVFVVKAGPAFELLATNTMSEVIMASPAISGGLLFIRTLGHLVAIG
jgi:outer membrane protein assembly factor BamB